MKVQSLARLPRAEHWANRIGTQHGKSVDAVIEVGRLLVKAKADLEHGEWLRMFEEQLVPFGTRTAQMLMTIAAHPELSNTNHGSHLPPSWRTLYDLSQVDRVKLKAALKDGVITPDMARRDVRALLPSKTQARGRVRSPVASYRTASSRVYFQIARVLSDEFEVLAPDEQDELLHLLDQLLGTLRATRGTSGGPA